MSFAIQLALAPLHTPGTAPGSGTGELLTSLFVFAAFALTAWLVVDLRHRDCATEPEERDELP